MPFRMLARLRWMFMFVATLAVPLIPLLFASLAFAQDTIPVPEVPESATWIAKLLVEIVNALSGQYGIVAQVASMAVSFLLLAHPVASYIVKHTATPRDDMWIGWLYANVLEPLAMANGKAKQLPPNQVD